MKHYPLTCHQCEECKGSGYGQYVNALGEYRNGPGRCRICDGTGYVINWPKRKKFKK